MNVRTDACDPRRLRLLAEDRLPAGEIPKLEDHLQNCDSCRSALDDLAGGEPWLGAVRHYLGSDPTAARDSAPNQPIGIDETLNTLTPSDWPDSLGRLGNYEIKGVIGRGGMGVVFKAFDPALHRTVAIKLLSPHLAGCGAARRRFLREARAAAAVVHEHVVSVHGVDDTPGRPPYLVMEYLPGRSLQDRLDEHGALALAEILRIGMQTAAGLAAAHAQGLVHRDVKPANILLENGIERVKLTDFGLARAAADAGMTQSGVVAGTPHYMAPEQARAESTDHRADLFSLGSTIYAMCTGVPPFRAETPVAVLRRVSDDIPRPIRQLNPEIPEWLEAIVDRLHAKDPMDRFASASEVAEVLGHCLAHVQEPLSVALDADLIPKRSKGPRRNWSSVLTTASLAAAVLVVVAAGLWRWTHRPVISVPVPISAEESERTNSSSFRAAADDAAALHEARDRVSRLEAELHRPADPPDTDRFSALVQDLADRAGSLERELAPILDVRPDVSRSPFPQNRTLSKGQNP